MAVEIICTNDGKLDCHSCDDKLKEERGHDKDGIIPFFLEGKYIYRCPLMIISKLSWDYVKSFNLYDKGFLPNGLSWILEGNKYIQAMNVLENEFNKFKNKKIENGK